MFTYEIIFGISLVLIIGMIVVRILYEKLHDQHVFHRVVTDRARRADWKLQDRLKEGGMRTRRFLRYFNKRTLVLLLHYCIEKVEGYFHKVTDFVRSKFPHHK